MYRRRIITYVFFALDVTDDAAVSALDDSLSELDPFPAGLALLEGHHALLLEAVRSVEAIEITEHKKGLKTVFGPRNI